MSETLDILYKKQSKAAKRVAKLNRKIDKELGKTELVCGEAAPDDLFRRIGCKKSSPINELEYIQTHWYTEPYSCTGGDYWNEGEGNYICPHCGQRQRLYNKPEIEKLKHLFKSIKEEYGR